MLLLLILDELFNGDDFKHLARSEPDTIGNTLVIFSLFVFVDNDEELVF